MLPKKERLTKEMFDRFFSSGRRFHGPTFQIVYSPASSFFSSVVVGKKIFKQAVKRNKVRRQIYNLLYKTKQEKGLTGVYVVLTKPTIKDASFAQIKEQLRDTLLEIEKRVTKG